MKTSNFIVSAALALLCSVGSAHAGVVCGNTPIGSGVTGKLEVLGGEITDGDLVCSGNPATTPASFLWTDNFGAASDGTINGGFDLNGDPLPGGSPPNRLSAIVSNSSIQLKMSVGTYGFFNDDMIWTFTLANGLVFGTISEALDTFTTDEDTVANNIGNAEFLGLADNNRTATFKINSGNHSYSTTWNPLYTSDTPFVANYRVETFTADNSVPEPSSLLLVVAALGIFAATQRSRRVA
jgi:hypothetical protein